MYLELEQVRDAGLSFDHALHLADTDEDGPARLSLSGPARLRGRAIHTPAGIELIGTLEAGVRVECSRCLEIYDCPIRASFELLLVGESIEFGAGETEISALDASLFYVQDGRADLRHAC